jgi:ribonucleoside-triphosphate reductase (formate)
MASGGPYSERVVEAHRVGDIHVHGSGRVGGCWAAWDSAAIVGDSVEPLERLSKFLAKARNEWYGFQKLSYFESLTKIGRIEQTKFNAGLPRFLESLEAIEGLRVFLGLEEQSREGASRLFLESLFRGLEGTGSSRVSPLVFFSKEYRWDCGDDLPIFESTGTLHSPIFLKRLEKDVDYLTDPWIGGSVKRVNTGVLDAVTLNIPRAAYNSDDEGDFMERVDGLVDVAVEALEARRVYLEGELRGGHIPATGSIVDSFDGFFGGVGVVGVHDALLNLSGKGIDSMQGKVVAYKILEAIHSRLREFEGETGHRFCRIAEPSDGVAYRFAELDEVKCPELGASGVDVPFYTGSTCLPVDYSDDLWDAMEHQKKLNALYTGGSVFNVYLEKGISDVDGVKTLVRRIVESTPLPCFALSPGVNVPSLNGDEKFERLGYWYTPVSKMCAGELEEVKLRKPYAVVSGW